MLLYFVIPIICNMTMVFKKVNFDLLNPTVRGVCVWGGGGGEGSTGKIYATTLLHDHDLKKLIYDIMTSSSRSGGGEGGIFATCTMLLHS